MPLAPRRLGITSISSISSTPSVKSSKSSAACAERLAGARFGFLAAAAAAAACFFDAALRFLAFSLAALAFSLGVGSNVGGF